MKKFFFLLSTLASCKSLPLEKVETSYVYPAVVEMNTNKKPLIILSYQKDCTEGKALKELGQIPIQILTNYGRESVNFDFSGVTGNGLRNQYISGVYKEYFLQLKHENCQKIRGNIYSCGDTKNKLLSGNLVNICEIPPEGFPYNSVENAALVATASYLKTLSQYKFNFSKSIKKIKLLIFPIFQREIEEGSEKIVSYDLDNARWVERSLKGENGYTIELLPPSINKNGNDLWSQMGVISHEAGHHIFNSLVPKLVERRSNLSEGDLNNLEEGDALSISYANPENAPTRTFGIETVISGLNEGFADLVAHYTFNSSSSPYFGFVFDKTLESRRVAADTGKYIEEKALTEPFIRHFFSDKKTFPPSNTYFADHQDDHALGAVVANALDSLYGVKFNETREHLETDKKYKLVLHWVTKLQDLFFSNSDLYSTIPYPKYSSNKGDAFKYDSGPALFLKHALYEAVKMAFVKKGTLSSKQCEILSRKFPVYAVEWSKEYKCE